MDVLNIIKEPNEILRKRSKEIPNSTDPSIKKLIPRMAKTMIKADGVGIAAPQVGINIRLIIINAKNKPFACINPVMKKKSLFTEWADEGCLSIPGMYGPVKRVKKVEVSFLDQYGKLITVKASGLMARIFQHEIDHINGILFIDRTKSTQKTA